MRAVTDDDADDAMANVILSAYLHSVRIYDRCTGAIDCRVMYIMPTN